MIKYLTVFFILVTFFSFAQQENFIRGELIIQFKEKASVHALKDNHVELGLNEVRLLSDRMNIWLFSYDTEGADDNEVKFIIKNDPLVKVVQFNHVLSMRELNLPPLAEEQMVLFPDDPMFGDQWHLNNTGQNGGTPDADIDAPEAWDITTGGVTALGDSIVVAIVDGGCQLNHPDINYWYNYGEIPNNSIDDDGNGYVDDFRGWNAYDNSPNVPSSGHGTHVSGITGAIGNNTIGVSGVNWNVKVMPVAGSSSDESTVVAAYAYVLEMRAFYNETNGSSGAFVVATNSSFGIDFGQPANYPIWCAMYDSLGEYGILSCAATANLNIDIDVSGDVPTACPSDFMIAVTNTTRNDLKNGGAAYGLTTIDLGAPGTSILSTYTGSSYTNLTGTSMATPMVTGAIGLLYAAANQTRIQLCKTDPYQGALQFRQLILDGVDSLLSLQGITVTGGRLNVNNSAILATDPVLPVELANFSASVINGKVNLNWSTATETNNYGFEIERLKDFKIAKLQDWELIGFVNGNGTTTEPKFYQYIDKDLSAGVYSYRLKQIDYDGTFEYSKIVEAEIFSPSKFELAQNYPNPFNPSTKIKFTIPNTNNPLPGGARGGFVSLKVYDILGSEVATLVNEDKPAGNYEVKFDASGLASGIYYYTLKAGEFVSTKKMILIK